MRPVHRKNVIAMSLGSFTRCAIILACTFLLPSLAKAKYYKWIDKEGRMHMTDNYYAVPDEYRKKAEMGKYGNGQGAEKLANDTPQRVVVHFKRQDNAIFVNAIINWKLPVVFHLDTGATSTMITRQDALALGIDPDTKPTVKGYIADGSLVEFPIATISSIAVGDAEVNNLQVAIGNVRLLGMNFLNDFKVNIDAESGQLILERKDLVREEESASIQEEKYHTIDDLNNQIDQIELAIRAKENIIKQMEADIRSTEEKVEKYESVLEEADEDSRFESSDISFDAGKKRRMEKYEEAVSRLNRHIEIRQDEIAIQLRQIDQLNDRRDQFDTLIMKLR
jgi:clan AA aspartic protease (TIGR02281 family)